jgi:hypothetical protein
MSGDARGCRSLSAIIAGTICFALPSVGKEAAVSATPACLADLPGAHLEKQLLCLREMRKASPAPAAALPPLCDILLRSDGNTDHVLIASVLDVFRSMGRRAAPAAETLSTLLPHQSPLNKERDKVLVVRLRAYIFVTLSEIGFPASALPVLLDTLAHVDERMAVVEMAAAVRAAGSLGKRGRPFAPLLLESLAVQLSAEEFSLERYGPQFPPQEATTVQMEIVRSLARICLPDNEQALTALRDLAEDRGRGLDPRLVTEARRALELMLGRPAKG